MYSLEIENLPVLRVARSLARASTGGEAGRPTTDPLIRLGEEWRQARERGEALEAELDTLCARFPEAHAPGCPTIGDLPADLFNPRQDRDRGKIVERALIEQWNENSERFCSPRALPALRERNHRRLEWFNEFVARRKKMREETGLAAAEEAWDEALDARDDLEDEIAEMQPWDNAGLLVQLRVAAAIVRRNNTTDGRLSLDSLNPEERLILSMAAAAERLEANLARV